MPSHLVLREKMRGQVPFVALDCLPLLNPTSLDHVETGSQARYGFGIPNRQRSASDNAHTHLDVTGTPKARSFETNIHLARASL